MIKLFLARVTPFITRNGDQENDDPSLDVMRFSFDFV